MIRTVFCLLYIIVGAVLLLPVFLIEAVIRLFSKRASETFASAFLGVMSHPLLWLSGARVKTVGRENIPKGEAVLYVGNHQGLFDVIGGLHTLRSPVGFIAKDSFAKIPYISWILKLMGCLFLNRDDLKQGLQVIKDAIEHVKDGRSIMIFPEGTRNRNEDDLDLLPFHKGSFKIAQRTGCKIVPVGFTGSRDILETHFPKIRRGKMIVRFGEPVPYTSLTKEEQTHIDSVFREKVIALCRENKEMLGLPVSDANVSDETINNTDKE